jgi:hypothetical protein
MEGATGRRDVAYAAPDAATGAIAATGASSWTAAPSLNATRGELVAVAAGTGAPSGTAGWLYALGGADGGIERAAIGAADGSLGPWSTLGATIPLTVDGLVSTKVIACAAKGSRIYIVGNDRVYYADVDPATGDIASVAADCKLLPARSYAAAAATYDPNASAYKLVVMGGQTAITGAAPYVWDDALEATLP